MSALAPGRAPRSDDEWATEINDRLRRLENPRTLRVGPWTILNDPLSGNLKAMRPGQTVVIDETGATDVAPVSVDLAGKLAGYVTSDQLTQAIDGIDTGGGWPGLGEVAKSIWTELYTKLTGLLNPVDALTQLASFFKLELGGPIRPGRLPLLPLSHIRDVNPNLLVDGTFSDEATLAGFPDWDYDEADGRSAPGSAYTTADGTTHTLHSNPIEVEATDSLDFEVYVKWVGLTAGPNSIQLAVSAYREDDVLIDNAPQVLASVANATGTAANWGTKLSASNWPVPDDAAYVVVELTVAATATAGFVKFDDAVARKVGAFPTSYVSGLVGALQTAANNLQGLLNNIWSGVTRQLIDGNKGLPDIFDVLGNIPSFNVIGVGGLATIGEALEETWSQLWGGFAQAIGIGGKSIADAANAAGSVAANADQAVQVGEWNNAILGIRNDNGFDSGMDPTAIANFELPGPTSAAGDPPFTTITSAAAPMAFWLAENDATRGVVNFFGRVTGSVTAVYIDVYRVNEAKTQVICKHISYDLLPLLASTWRSVRYAFDEALRETVAHGDVLGFAFRITGTGSMDVVAKWAGWLPSDTSQPVRRPSATRPGSAPAVGGAYNLSGLTWAGDIPWVAVGIMTGDVAPPFYAPRTTEFATPGLNQPYDIPTWAKYLDIVLISGAGGGHGGSGGTSFHGLAGLPGEWRTETLVRGVDFPANATRIYLDIGAGGTGGGREANGGSGGATVRRAITSGKAALTAPGGVARDGYNTNDAQGRTPNPAALTYQGKTYNGGQGGVSSSAQNGQPGSAPGGSGAGGAGGFYTVAWAGGAGARGGGWVTARST
ncbi:minor tail protein [Mycobacterium phage LilMcDreamy]|uniref:Minor tail protein n=1 Tax=Mycobacterium phage LilMcDreamy TaxID=2652422 RepID=A0A5P8D6I8_9CAUD|nr:minor tail protein [Mycobacterium phage LilMcDreamy]QFP94647.1 minor tail protein [Mycobacterium phage LilMcDreamy]